MVLGKISKVHQMLAVDVLNVHRSLQILNPIYSTNYVVMDFSSCDLDFGSPFHHRHRHDCWTILLYLFLFMLSNTSSDRKKKSLVHRIAIYVLCFCNFFVFFKQLLASSFCYFFIF